MQRGRVRSRRDLTQRLPVEILAIIFHYLKDSYYPNERGIGADWVRISWICKRWREVALQTPSLWSSILISPLADPADDQALETQLDRARGAPLDISVCDPQECGEEVEDALRLVLARSPRPPVKKLQVHSHDSLPAVAEFVMAVAASVVSLSIDSVHGCRDGRESWLFTPDAFPRLRRLSLSRITPTATAGAPLLSLTRLDLAHAYDEYAVPPGLAVHRFLGACPNLEKLNMGNCFMYDPKDMIEEHGPNVLPVVTLPRLRSLWLDQVACDIATALGTLRLPALASFHVDADCSNGYTGAAFPVVPQNITEALPPIRRSRSLALIADGEVRLRGSSGPGETGGSGYSNSGEWSVTVFGLVDRVAEDEEHQYLCSVQEFCGLFLARIPQLVVPAALVRLELHVADGLPVARDWARFFAGMPRLRALAVGSGALVRLVLAAFASEGFEDEGKGGRLCPGLEDLELCVGRARDGDLANVILRALGTWVRARTTPLQSLTVKVPKYSDPGAADDSKADSGSGSDSDAGADSASQPSSDEGGSDGKDTESVESWARKLCQDVGLTLKGFVLKVFLVGTDCPACGVEYEPDDWDAIDQGKLSNGVTYY